MQINKAGLDLIKKFEGLSLKAYQDVGGVWTIGYGSTHRVDPGMEITKLDAEARLLRDLTAATFGVNRIINSLGIPVTSNQFSALVCFAYNVGVGALTNSSIITNLDNDRVSDAADCFLKYVFAKGVKIQGLVNRRTAERELFLTEDTNVTV